MIRNTTDELLNELTKDNPKLKELADQYEIQLNVAVLVASLRKSANFTQQEIAQKAHISKSTIIKIENGTTIPTLTTLDKIGKAVGKHISISFK